MKLLERLDRACRMVHLAKSTREQYIRWVEQFLRFRKDASGVWRSPGELRGADVAAFLTHMPVERRLSESSQNQSLCAIVFLYGQVFGDVLGSATRHLSTLWCRCPACEQPRRLHHNRRSNCGGPRRADHLGDLSALRSTRSDCPPSCDEPAVRRNEPAGPAGGCRWRLSERLSAAWLWWVSVALRWVLVAFRGFIWLSVALKSESKCFAARRLRRKMVEKRCEKCFRRPVQNSRNEPKLGRVIVASSVCGISCGVAVRAMCAHSAPRRMRGKTVDDIMCSLKGRRCQSVPRASFVVRPMAGVTVQGARASSPAVARGDVFVHRALSPRGDGGRGRPRSQEASFGVAHRWSDRYRAYASSHCLASVGV
jgi:hypothetical protein